MGNGEQHPTWRICAHLDNWRPLTAQMHMHERSQQNIRKCKPPMNALVQMHPRTPLDSKAHWHRWMHQSMCVTIPQTTTQTQTLFVVNSIIKLHLLDCIYNLSEFCQYQFCSSEAETITSLDDIYQVGAFVQITELYDMGDKMRMVVLGHRRFV